ncbi:hypothetical protein RD055328_12960 [Companilactobacillus sp. RD055328]|uniref:M15 family metallopeptidase n=1 Tax=Companilactobacillus sp. RD055328 TaxID=2916634 RepID=UPI001FC7C539|nr:M15 family metallopeptidase [Companilactobacillus sp. RD055328]GKQ43373.1 hypothetical protein RD055328_12960 [Companilactobacillus sp. RD055328]
MKRTYFIMAIIMMVSISIIGAFAINTKKPQETTISKVKKNKTQKLNSPLLIVVNKKHPLTSDYNPYQGELLNNNPNGSGLLPKANQAKDKIISAMQKKGFDIANEISGYRSYDYQKQIYDDYVNKEGSQKADTYSARPGYSDHQTGLAFDLLGTSGELPTNDEMYSWLENNAYKYGLIIRFPRNKTKITGYMGEEWHLRYIGVKYATEMHTKNIKTLEEFTKVSGGNYNKDIKNDVSALNQNK